jgi:Na+-driven multidrug efflux pump
MMAAGAMLALMVLVLAGAHRMVNFFSADAQVVAVGSEYLRILCWTFILSGIVFVGSSMFQAMGNTLPALVASFTRIVLVAVPAFIVARMAGFQLHWIWYLSVAAGVVQFVLVLVLLEREFRRKLSPMEATVDRRGLK